MVMQRQFNGELSFQNDERHLVFDVIVQSFIIFIECRLYFFLFLVFQSSVSYNRFSSLQPENAASQQHVISVFPAAADMFLTPIEIFKK